MIVGKGKFRSLGLLLRLLTKFSVDQSTLSKRYLRQLQSCNFYKRFTTSRKAYLNVSKKLVDMNLARFLEQLVTLRGLPCSTLYAAGGIELENQTAGLCGVSSADIHLWSSILIQCPYFPNKTIRHPPKQNVPSDSWDTRGSSVMHRSIGIWYFLSSANRF